MEQAMMHAICVHAAGDAKQCRYERIARPRPAADEVLVRVFAAGVNPVDTKVRQREPFMRSGEVFIPGCDGAGIIEVVGDAVEDFSVGDAVCYCYGGIGQPVGNYAEYTCVPTSYLTHKAEGINMLQAAAMPLVCITAWEALFDRARLSEGQTVLVLGGTGGTGHVAVQLAKAAGCRVACTVGSEEKAAVARQLGADHVIHYRHQSVTEAVAEWTQGRGVDVLLDTVGGQALPEVQDAVAHYGTLVSLLQFPAELDWKQLRLKNIVLAQELMLSPMLFDHRQAAEHQAAIVAQCQEMMEEGRLQIRIADTLPLAAAWQAHERIAQGNTCGKLVLDCTEDATQA